MWAGDGTSMSGVYGLHRTTADRTVKLTVASFHIAVMSPHSTTVLIKVTRQPECTMGGVRVRVALWAVLFIIEPASES